MAVDGREMSHVLALVQKAKELAVGLDSNLVEPFLADWPAATSIDRDGKPVSLPVLNWLQQLPDLATQATRPLAGLLVAGAAQLQWRQSYSELDFGTEFLERYGWSELIGLRGPIASERIAVGFLMLGPRTHYPEHSHEAEEIYLPIAGKAEWRSGQETWRVEEPGALIHHRAWLAHATRTRGEPLLALYLWRGGDLKQKPEIGVGKGKSTSRA